MPAQVGEKYGRLTPLYVVGKTKMTQLKQEKKQKKIYHKEFHYDN